MLLKLKIQVVIISLFLCNLLHAQPTKADYDKFVSFFKSELPKFKIGKIEGHYEEGFFKILTASEYFDIDVEVGLTSLAQKCMGKDSIFVRQEINSFFERHKKLKNERELIGTKMNDFNYMKSFLKVRIYSDMVKPQYAKYGLIKSPYKGFFEAVVFDLPSGIGSVEKKYLETWQKSEIEIYSLARENTLKSLTQKFSKTEAGKDGEVFYLLSSDYDLFVTSAVIELNKMDIPQGKYGTLISLPSSNVIVALPLSDSSKINQFALRFMDVTNYMYENNQTTQISAELFWYNGVELLSVGKDNEKKELIYPSELKKVVR